VFCSGVAGNNIEEVVDLVLVIHGYLCLALVTPIHTKQGTVNPLLESFYNTDKLAIKKSAKKYSKAMLRIRNFLSWIRIQIRPFLLLDPDPIIFSSRILNST
jgi:hypothetical protein